MVERRMPAIVVEPCLTVFLDLLLIKRAGVRSGELPLKTYFSKALSLSILVSETMWLPNKLKPTMKQLL